MTLPRLFIGSSTEGLDVAYALQENLEAEVTVWSQGFFEPSTATLSALLQKLGEFDFAIVVFSPDDVLRLRGHEFRTARDNVLFELGLFYGRLGAERCFFAMPRGIADFHLLLGIAPLTVARSDGNLVAALATAANQVRRTLRKIAQTPQLVPSTKPLTTSNLRSLQDFVTAWNGPELTGARDQVRQMPWGEFGPERDTLAQVFAFLESLSDAILAGRIDEREARVHFGEAIPSVWSVAFTELAPPNHADEWWEPTPKIAELSQRWKR